MVDVIQFCVAGSVSFHVAHIALVPRNCIWPSMRLIGGIKMRTGRTGIGCAAIAEFMDMEAVLTRRQARNFCVHLYAVGDWRECNRTADLIACGGMQYRNAF